MYQIKQMWNYPLHVWNGKRKIKAHFQWNYEKLNVLIKLIYLYHHAKIKKYILKRCCLVISDLNLAYRHVPFYESDPVIGQWQDEFLQETAPRCPCWVVPHSEQCPREPEGGLNIQHRLTQLMSNHNMWAKYGDQSLSGVRYGNGNIHMCNMEFQRKMW